ncbi:MAG TPA: alpha/beta hydrolase [Acidimicrobiia bacterium]|jgi:thioesterase CepJ
MLLSEQGTVVVGDVQLAYDRSGEGDPVVFICGTGMPRIAWLQHRPIFEQAGYQTIVFDSRGVGDSDAPPPPYTVEEMTADTAGLIEQLDLASCHVIGLSQGGMIAEELTRARPDLVRTAVLMGSAGRESAYARLLSEAELEVAQTSPLRHVDTTQTLTMSLSSRELQDDATVELWAELIGTSDWSGPGRIGQVQANMGWGERDHWEESWAAISRPVLVMSFEHDILLPPAAGREAAKHMPHGEFVEIEGVGHGGAMMKADEVCRVAMEFFARH